MLPWLRHGRSGSEHVASAFEGTLSMSDHVVTLDSRRDNDRDNRVAAQRCVVSGADDKIGVSQSSAERCFRKRKPRLRFIALLYSHYPFRAVLPRHQETAECDGGLQPISYQVDFSVQVTPIAWSDTLRSLEGARIRPLFQIREIQQLLVDLLRPDVRA